jgi:hypothetical protein
LKFKQWWAAIKTACLTLSWVRGILEKSAEKEKRRTTNERICTACDSRYPLLLRLFAIHRDGDGGVCSNVFVF